MANEQQPAAKITLYIDNMVWDFLLAREMDICVELPPTEWSLRMTREAELEIPISPEKADLKAFIKNTMDRCGIEITPYFGFGDPSAGPGIQLYGGWGIGHWQTRDESTFIEEQKSRLGTKVRPTGLLPNEADISIAARAVHSVVLSCEKKAGPIKSAKTQGAMVVLLDPIEFDNSGQSLAAFIRAKIAAR